VAKVNVAECWSQIEKWLSANSPAAVPMLPPGVTDAALAQAEATLGFAIPREVKEFLAVHDGSGPLWLHDRGEFMSLDGILAAWDQEFDLWGDGNNDEWANPQGPIKKKWFTRRWLPVLDARTGDHVCVDLDPPKGGRRGQVFTWYHDGGPSEVIAPSFGALLAEFVAELAGGRYAPRLNQAGQPYLEYSAEAEPGAAADGGA
jgi:cell wall assembly regulator SMI1